MIKLKVFISIYALCPYKDKLFLLMPLKCRMPPLKFMATQKQPSQETERAADVLRTGIEPYMYIN
jgi:hypothetical protein